MSVSSILSTFFPKLERRVFHSIARSSLHIFGSNDEDVLPPGGCVVIEEREKFWSFAIVASPAGRAAKMLAIGRFVSQSPATTSERRILRESIPFLSPRPRIIPSVNTRACARTWTCFVSGFSLLLVRRRLFCPPA